MAPHFSLTWDVQKNICSGLSSLQQNGEFVDMTLAADGHFVKVHQMVMALASPYIKALLASVECPHPVIFLNKVSYKTLCSLLEYVYTGEVMVSVEHLKELITAGQELHIKGIEDMSVQQSLSRQESEAPAGEDEEICFFEIDNTEGDNEDNKANIAEVCDTYSQADSKQQDMTETVEEEMYDENETLQEEEDADGDECMVALDSTTGSVDSSANTKAIQYTVSNRGSLQMILNRFVYYMKHTNKNQVRQWRCVDYLGKGRCPAHVITHDDVVIKRVGAHKHPFHDKKILKKLETGSIFSAIHEVERESDKQSDKGLASPPRLKVMKPANIISRIES